MNTFHCGALEMIYLPMLKFDFMAAQFCRTRAELTRDAF
jgi:hypothetical protein